MSKYPRTLFICHGRLHKRRLEWFVHLRSKLASKWWDDAIYLDNDSRTCPDTLFDISKAPSSLFPSNTFNRIVNANCPIKVHFTDSTFSHINAQFWKNISNWLKSGGIYITPFPQQLLRPSVGISTSHASKKSDSSKPHWLQRFAESEGVNSEDLSNMSVSVALGFLEAFSSGSNDFERLRNDAKLKNSIYKKLADWLVEQQYTAQLRPKKRISGKSHEHKTNLLTLFAKKLSLVGDQVQQVTNGALVVKPCKDTWVDSDSGDFVVCFIKAKKA